MKRLLLCGLLCLPVACASTSPRRVLVTLDAAHHDADHLIAQLYVAGKISPETLLRADKLDHEFIVAWANAASLSDELATAPDAQAKFADAVSHLQQVLAQITALEAK